MFLCSVVHTIISHACLSGCRKKGSGWEEEEEEEEEDVVEISRPFHLPTYQRRRRRGIKSPLHPPTHPPTYPPTLIQTSSPF